MHFHCFDCNLATARFLDEVQSYSGVNKMSAQNLATVFGPNILRPKVEDPLTIMEGKWMIDLRACFSQSASITSHPSPHIHRLAIARGEGVLLMLLFACFYFPLRGKNIPSH